MMFIIQLSSRKQLMNLSLPRFAICLQVEWTRPEGVSIKTCSKLKKMHLEFRRERSNSISLSMCKSL